MATIKDVLKDLVSYAVPLNLQTIRVTGTETSTIFEGVDENNKIIMKATSAEPILEFTGRFGMPRLGVLKAYVDIFSSLEEVDEKTKISNLLIEIQRNAKSDPTVPTDINFSNPTNNALYRLQKDGLERQPNIKDGITWDVEISQPEKKVIDRFSSFAAALSGVEKHFSVKTVGTSLKFYIGDENSSISKVNFVFAENVKNKVDAKASWACSDFLSIMNLCTNADTVVKITSLGVIQITVDTGIMTYNFMLPGTKT